MSRLQFLWRKTTARWISRVALPSQSLPSALLVCGLHGSLVCNLHRARARLGPAPFLSRCLLCDCVYSSSLEVQRWLPSLVPGAQRLHGPW